MRRRAIPYVLLLCALLLAACSPTSSTASLQAQTPDLAPGFNGVAVEDAPQMPEAEFVDADGEPFDLRAAVADKPTLVYFGYTNCPDVCPVHLANIAAALRAGSVRPEQLNVVFVTTDPARDTPEVLDDYMANFHPSFIGLTTSENEIERVMAALDLPGPVLEKTSESALEYTVGHPLQVLAFDRGGFARIAYPFGTRQSQWVEDLPKIVREDWS